MTPDDLDRLAALERAASTREILPGYILTDEGEVYSTASNWRGYGVHRLIPRPDGHGYLYICVMKDGRKKQLRLHKLVATYFISPKPSPSHQVRHLDGNKVNNRLSNLAWGTAKENGEDKVRHGTNNPGNANSSRRFPERLARGDRNGMRTHPESVIRGTSKPNAKLTNQKITEIRRLRSEHVPVTEIAIRYGVDWSNVYRILRGGAWSHA